MTSLHASSGAVLRRSMGGSPFDSFENIGWSRVFSRVFEGLEG